MAGNRKRSSLWIGDNVSPCSTILGRQTSSEPQAPAGPSRTLLEESSNDSQDVIIIDNDTAEIAMGGNRKRVSMWTDDNKSPSSKFRRLDISGGQTSSELEFPAGPSKTLIKESSNDSHDVIIIDSDTEEDDVILTGITYPNGRYVNIGGEERRRRRRRRLMSTASSVDISADTSDIEDEETTVDSSSEIVREVGDIEEEKNERVITERQDQLTHAVEPSSYENNGDVEAEFLDIETLDNDSPVTEASSFVYEEDVLHEDLFFEDEGNSDDEADRREDGDEDDQVEENAAEEAANEEDEWNTSRTLEEYDAEQEDFMYTFDVPEILWEAGFDLLEDFFQLEDPVDGEEFMDDNSLQPVYNGLSQKEIDNFPTKKITECDCNSESTSKCIICLSEFQSGDVVRILKPCEHEFHQDCIDEWLKSHKTCPLCRTYVDDWSFSLN